MAQERIFTRNFALLFLGRSTTSMVFSMTGATMVTFALDYYHVSVTQAGFLVGAFILGALMVRFVAGQLIGWFGCRRLTIVASVVYAVLGASYFLPVPYEGFVALRFMHGMAFGVTGTTFNVMGALVIPRSRYGEAMGVYSLSGTLSGALGPFIGVILLNYGTYQMLFAATVAIAVISLVCLLASRSPDPPKPSNLPPKWHFSFKPNDILELSAVPLASLAFLVAACYSCINAMLNTHAGSLGLEVFVPWVFVLYSVITAASRPFAGRLLDSKGDNFVMLPAFVFYAIGLLLFGFADSGFMLFVAIAFVAIGQGTAFTSMQTIVLRESTPERLGYASSTFYVFADAGSGLGPAFMGALAGMVGFSNMYLISAGIIAVLALLYIPAHGLKSRKK